VHIDELSLKLSNKAVAQLLQTITLPQGFSIIGSALSDNALELLVRTPAYRGVPIKLRFTIESYSGSKIILKVRPPLKLVLSRLFSQLPQLDVTTYATHAQVEIDLVSASKGKLLSLDIRKIVINRQMLTLEIRNLVLNANWRDQLQLT